MKKIFAAMLVMSVVGVVGTANAGMTLDSVSATWSNAVGGSDVDLSTPGTVLWGRKNADTIPPQSGLMFVGTAPQTVTLGEVFQIGTLTHYNNRILLTSAIDTVDFQLDLAFSDPTMDVTFTGTMGVDETPNGDGAVDDEIILPSGFPAVADSVVYGDMVYTLTLLGFGPDADNIGDTFFSPEDGTNSTNLYGVITARPVVPAPGAILLVGLGSGLVGFLRRRQCI